MDEYHYGMDSEINCTMQSEFSSFINEVGEEDLTNNFTTNEIFSFRENLIEWVKGIVNDLGFVVVTTRSDKATGQPGRKTFVLLGCERGGKYRKYKPDQRSAYGTRKCECPFQLRGKPSSNGDGWVLQVICGYHNHDLAKTLVGHPYADRLNPTEQAVLVDMTKTQVTLANILLTLKQNNEHNVTTIKQVYTARYTYKRSLRGSRTELQQLMMMLDRDNYIRWSRCAEDSEVVSDLFWTHPDAIKLLNAFNVVLLMDSTYKTNKYRLPLLEIVGMTSTGLTYSIAFAFLSSERQNNFTWALQKLRGLFLTSDTGP
ncbi:protein FAR-RED ELONGATED HYPOCOTYL 3-like [Vigna angularis]|uniref:protein FAR-RED ELONGATED HYPOCOTYL 3-like n=1 Tax=Phaseolus angularis TaxID=3914 RepID=UPI0022B49F48|nr:protein FAR-RED ELONGATED HYPOCOTYL 3-like [Vigna angularis]